MEIHGFQKTTLLDYPGHVAATVFTGGCNFRCPFCHNGSLVLHPEGQPVISEEEILSYLKKRQGVLEGVCVTGGEPTLQKGLPEFLGKLKELGYLVKLDTNGSNPQVLEELLKANRLDYVAMDVKASLDHYEAAVGIKGFDPSSVRESIGLLKACNIPNEFRTTVVKGIHTVEEFEKIGRMLEGCQAYYLQGFQESGDMIGAGCGAFCKEEMEKMACQARKYIDKVMLRGVE